MAYQEVTTTNYGQRLSSSFKGIGMGIVLFLAGTALLWWNEGRAVKTTAMLNEAEGVAVHVESVEKVDPSLEGKLIHATAQAQTTESLMEDRFGINVVGIALQREVEYYQWVEEKTTQEKDKIGGGKETVTTYNYHKKWTAEPVQSSNFADSKYKESNGVWLQVPDQNLRAKEVSLGGYKLGSMLISQISGKVPLELKPTAEQLAAWNQIFSPNTSNQVIVPAADSTATAAVPAVPADTTVVQKVAEAAQNVAQAVTGLTTKNKLQVQNNVMYYGANSAAPNVGDVRITFTYIPASTVSVIAKVSGQNLSSFKAKNGKTLARLSMGEVSMEEMFESAHSSNTLWTWVLRFVGLFLVIGGLKGVFGFVIAILKVLPFLADIVGLGVGLICNVLGFVWSLIIILLAWITYRPMIAIGLLVVIAAAIAFLVKKGKDKKKEEEAAQGPQPQPEAPKADK